MRDKVIWQGGKGRDSGKIYELTEASPFTSFKWGMLAAHALSDKIPSEYSRSIDGVSLWIQHAGLADVIKADPEKLFPLLEELLTCVRYKNSLDSATSMPIIPGDDRGYIEESQTIVDLYYQVFVLHTAFYTGEKL